MVNRQGGPGPRRWAGGQGKGHSIRAWGACLYGIN